MSRAIAEKLPYGVGQIGTRWVVTAILALVMLCMGLYAFARQLADGEGITGLGDIGTGAGATWGLYVVFIIYFIGVSFAGITIAGFVRLFNVQELKPITRIAELLTIVSLILGALLVIIDLGQPGRGLSLFQYARPESPQFFTFSLVWSGYLFATVVFLYLTSRKDAAILAKHPGKLQGFHRWWAAGYKDTPDERARHERTTWWLAMFIPLLLIEAHSVLGFIFGSQSGQPGWFSALQAPGFVVLAGVSGIGLLIIVVAIARKVLNLEDSIQGGAFRWLGNMMWILTSAYLYFVLMETLTGIYAAPEAEQDATRELLSGDYAWAFWSSVGLFVITMYMTFFQFTTGRYSIKITVWAGVLVTIAAVIKRYALVIPSQTKVSLLPYESGSYSPTWVEYLIIVGLLGLGILMYIGFAKIFPLAEVREKLTGGGQ